MIENLVQLEATANLSDRMVSVQDFLEFLESTGQKAEIGPKMQLFEQLEECPALPVTNVTWFEAAAYCRWYNEQLREKIPSLRQAVRLPHEWELALAEHQARSLVPDSFWDAWPMKSKEEALRVLNASHRHTYGMADILGAVYSWTSDTAAGGSRVSRGGSWYNAPSSLRASNRFRYAPSLRSVNLGFRLAFN